METFRPTAGPFWKCPKCNAIDCCPPNTNQNGNI